MGEGIFIRLVFYSGESGGKSGRRFSRCEATPSVTSGPVKPKNSRAKDVSKVGPALRDWQRRGDPIAGLRRALASAAGSA